MKIFLGIVAGIFVLSPTNAWCVGPRLLLHLNEAENATVFRDSSGNNFDATCTNCPTRGAYGIFNPALTFDGVNDRLEGIAMGAAGTSDWTISAWVRTTDAAAGMVVTNRSAGGEVSNSLHSGWWAGAASSNGRVYFSNDGPGCEYGAISTSTITNGNFHHIVGIRSATSNYQIYVNGVLEGTNNISVGAGCNTLAASSTANWLVGDGPAWGGSQWVGQIAEVAVYDQALTRSLVRGMYLRGVNRHREMYREWFDLAGYPAFFFNKVFWRS